LVLKHPDKPGGRVTVPVHARETLYPKTLLAILEQAEMTVDEFRRLI
jgi:predicted RNA binding protein YcfA (HicA-like mRNA interferase family)